MFPEKANGFHKFVWDLSQTHLLARLGLQYDLCNLVDRLWFQL